MLGRCPVLAVPISHATNRVPAGMQIVGHPWAEPDVLRIGLACEQVVGGSIANAATRQPLECHQAIGHTPIAQ